MLEFVGLLPLLGGDAKFVRGREPRGVRVFELGHKRKRVVSYFVVRLFGRQEVFLFFWLSIQELRVRVS